MSAEIYNLRDYQKPVPQSESLLAQATSLVGFINGLTAKDQTPDFSQAGAYHAPDKDAG